jgi:hypothetical protein
MIGDQWTPGGMGEFEENGISQKNSIGSGRYFAVEQYISSFNTLSDEFQR